jgi:hypothetical protein
MSIYDLVNRYIETKEPVINDTCETPKQLRRYERLKKFKGKIKNLKISKKCSMLYDNPQGEYYISKNRCIIYNGGSIFKDLKLQIDKCIFGNGGVCEICEEKTDKIGVMMCDTCNKSVCDNCRNSIINSINIPDACPFCRADYYPDKKCIKCDKNATNAGCRIATCQDCRCFVCEKCIILFNPSGKICCQ